MRSHSQWQKLVPIGAAALLGTLLNVSALDISKVPASDWIDLFNGVDLKDWVPKVVGTAAGQDPLKTWYVKDGILWVDYSGYGGTFNNRWGHMAYEKRKFSYYVFHTESNSWGKQVNGGPSWAIQNNGIMFHSQSMGSMSLGQSYPTSVEYQLLGAYCGIGNHQNDGGGSTADVCGSSSNTSMILNGSRVSPGCSEKQKHVQLDSGHWVVNEGLVLGDSLVKHMVAADTNKPMDTVLTYSKLQTRSDGKPLTEGYIAIQAETAPWKFRKIRVLDLDGCMDPKFTSYRSYFVHSNPSLCTVTTVALKQGLPKGFALEVAPGEIRITLPHSGAGYRVKVADLGGRVVIESKSGNVGETRLPTRGLRPGIYFAEVSDGKSVHRTGFSLLEAGGF